MPYFIETWQAAIEPDSAGMANGETWPGPFSARTWRSVDDLLEPAAAGVDARPRRGRAGPGRMARSRCPASSTASVAAAIARWMKRLIRRAILRSMPMRRVEVLDLGRDPDVEARRIELRDRADADDAGEEVLPVRRGGVADGGDGAEAGDDGATGRILGGHGPSPRTCSKRRRPPPAAPSSSGPANDTRPPGGRRPEPPRQPIGAGRTRCVDCTCSGSRRRSQGWSAPVFAQHARSLVAGSRRTAPRSSSVSGSSASVDGLGRASGRPARPRSSAAGSSRTRTTRRSSLVALERIDVAGRLELLDDPAGPAVRDAEARGDLADRTLAVLMDVDGGPDGVGRNLPRCLAVRLADRPVR